MLDIFILGDMIIMSEQKDTVHKQDTVHWVSVSVNIFFAFISIGFAISSCRYSKTSIDHSKKANEYAEKANTHYEKQAISALEVHNPYVGIITHYDNGNKKHGIFVKNYAGGLAIIDSIKISGESDPHLNQMKWQNVLRNNGFEESEISCFSFTLPHKNMGLSGNAEVPLIFVSSEMEKEAESNGFIHRCINENLMSKLETIDIQIFYKSRLPNSEIQKAYIWKVY